MIKKRKKKSVQSAAAASKKKKRMDEAFFVPLPEGALDGLRRVPHATLRVSPFCYQDDNRLTTTTTTTAAAEGGCEVRGWVLDLPADTSAAQLPLADNLFHGVAVAMCDLPEHEVYRLMMAADTRQRLGAALRPLLPATSVLLVPKKQEDDADDDAATWERCRPRNGPEGVPRSLHGAQKRSAGIEFVPDALHQQSFAIIDGGVWRARLSPDGFIGLYARWCCSRDDLDLSTTNPNHTNPNTAGPARLRLYIACQSYLPEAARDLARLVRGVRGAGTAGYVCLSEEVQWLRAACARNRARLIAQVSERMGLRVATMDDYLAAPGTPVMQRRMAVVCTETLHHDLVFVPARDAAVVRVLSYCADTSGARNGSVCLMAPWAPLWVFGGGGDAYHHDGGFGQPVAIRGRTLVLPTTTVRLCRTGAGGAGGGGRHLCFVARSAGGGGVLDVWSSANHNNSSSEPPPPKKRLSSVRNKKNRPAPTNNKTTAAGAEAEVDRTAKTIEDDVRLAYQRALALSMPMMMQWDAPPPSAAAMTIDGGSGGAAGGGGGGGGSFPARRSTMSCCLARPASSSTGAPLLLAAGRFLLIVGIPAVDALPTPLLFTCLTRLVVFGRARRGSGGMPRASHLLIVIREYFCSAAAHFSATLSDSSMALRSSDSTSIPFCISVTTLISLSNSLTGSGRTRSGANRLPVWASTRSAGKVPPSLSKP